MYIIYCIHFSKNYNRWDINLTGNKHIVDGFGKFIKSSLKSRASTRPSGADKYSYQIAFSGISLPQKVLSIIYANSSNESRMSRKHDKAKLCWDSDIRFRKKVL